MRGGIVYAGQVAEAFADKTVDGIMIVIGDYNSIEILSGIDYRLIAENPKMFCGFSDITA